MQQATQPVVAAATPTQPADAAFEGPPKPNLVKNEAIVIDDPVAGEGTSGDTSLKNDEDGSLNGGKIPFKKIFQKRKKSSGKS